MIVVIGLGVAEGFNCKEDGDGDGFGDRGGILNKFCVCVLNILLN